MSGKKQELKTEQTTDFESLPVDLQDYTSFSVQTGIVGSADFESTITLQVSNDFDNWIDVPSTTLVLEGVADVQIYDVVQSAAAYARVKVIISVGEADFDIDWMLK